MVKVSVIIPCKGRLDHLQTVLPTVVMQDYPNLEIIVVDYNCPQGTNGYIKNWNSIPDNMQITCVKADVEDHEWSLSAARNLGYKHAKGEMLLFLDADAMLIDRAFITTHVNHCVDGSFVCGWGHGEATGCSMLRKTAFEAADGYNELIKSWGAEDIRLYYRLENELAQERRNWLGGIETIKHGDELRNLFHDNRPPLETNDENFQITQHKGLKNETH